MNTPTMFNYVVGHPWDPEYPEHLCIYTYHNQIQRGTRSDAEEFLAYVKSKNPHRPYRIYKVAFTPVETT
jgi:hypothetical protein